MAPTDSDRQCGNCWRHVRSAGVHSAENARYKNGQRAIDEDRRTDLTTYVANRNINKYNKIIRSLVIVPRSESTETMRTLCVGV